MTSKSLLERLDDSVRWTGIPALTQYPLRRRPMRWPSTIAVVLAIGGFVTLAIDPSLYMAGYSAVMLGFTAAIFSKMLGLPKPYGAPEIVDEWDRSVRERSYAFAYLALSLTVPILLVVLPSIGMLAQWDMATLTRVVSALGFTLMAIFAALPTVHASWSIAWADDS